MEIKYGTSGSAVALLNGEFVNIKWKPTPNCSYHIDIEVDNGTEFQITDYDDRLDVMYSPSDDGTIWYYSMVVLDDGETAGKVPSKEELAEVYTRAKPVFDSVAVGDTDIEDLGFAMLILRSQECMYRAYNKTGSVEKADRLIMKDIFRL